MINTQTAKQTLLKNGYTCFLYNETTEVFSTLRGVKPLVEFVKSNKKFEGFVTIDKVVGKATAFLYAKLKVKEVYALVISKPALVVLKQNNISTKYDVLVDNIINRKGNGICPFEEAVLKVTDIETAYKTILQKLEEFKNNP